MSSHHSRKAINLHHDQVTAGKNRRLRCQVDRLQGYLSRRKQFHFEHNFVLASGFICFAYMALATPFYLKYVLGFL